MEWGVTAGRERGRGAEAAHAGGQWTVEASRRSNVSRPEGAGSAPGHVAAVRTGAGTSGRSPGRVQRRTRHRSSSFEQGRGGGCPGPKRRRQASSPPSTHDPNSSRPTGGSAPHARRLTPRAARPRPLGRRGTGLPKGPHGPRRAGHRQPVRQTPGRSTRCRRAGWITGTPNRKPKALWGKRFWLQFRDGAALLDPALLPLLEFEPTTAIIAESPQFPGCDPASTPSRAAMVLFANRTTSREG